MSCPLEHCPWMIRSNLWQKSIRITVVGRSPAGRPVQRLHMFVLDLAPGSLPSVEEVDTNELMKACEDIIAAYDAPARKARMEAKLAEAREALNRPEVQKLLTLQNLKK